MTVVALVQMLLALVGIYALVGIVFAAWFVSGGFRRIDSTGITTGARLLIFPGSAALWPLLAVRTLTAGKAPAAEEQS